MNIYESISKAMEEIQPIAKGRKNTQQNFMYRGIDDVMNDLQPIFSKYHIFAAPEVLEMKREERQTKNGGNLIYSVLKVKYTFYAEDGTNISTVIIGEGMDSGDKASNKALAVAFKYACTQVFCIPTEDQKDPDATTPEQSRPVKSVPDQVEDKAARAELIKEFGNVMPAKDSNGKDVFTAEEKDSVKKAIQSNDATPEGVKNIEALLAKQKNILAQRMDKDFKDDLPGGLY